MYKASLCTLALITALTAGSLIANAQSYSNTINLPGITGLISHDAVPEGFDPVSASLSDLQEYGFPQRPDPSDTKPYSKWLQAVSLTRVTGEWVNTGRYHLPNQSKGPAVANTTVKDNTPTYTSGNWSGYAIGGGSPVFVEVEGYWVVPSINNQFGIKGNSYMSEWIGIDGDCSCNDLMQDGTEQDWTGGKPGYYAWVEYFPEAEVEVSSFPVSPGDVIQAYTWATEKSGVVYGNFYLANFNTRKAVSGSLKIPKGSSFSGKSAEWIVERTEVNGSFTNELPFYAYTYMDDAYAWRNGSSHAIPYASEVNQNIIMVQGSTHLSQVSEQDGDSMWFKWDNY